MAVRGPTGGGRPPVIDFYWNPAVVITITTRIMLLKVPCKGILALCICLFSP